MRDFKDRNPNDRLSDAAKGKRSMLERVRAIPAADDPVFLERKAAKQAIATERAARNAERVAAKERAASERAAKGLEEQTEQAALALREAKERAERHTALVAEQKAARDARYAARKKRKL